MKTKKIIAFTLALTLAGPAISGIPVTDVGNAPNHTITSLEQVAQTLKQIEQYKTQLEQYETDLRNAAAPAAYIWDQANKTISDLTNAVNTLEHYKSNLGSLDNYLSQFQDVNYYKQSSCFAASGCSAAEMAAVKRRASMSSEAQKRANDALFRGLDKQQQSLTNDAQTLRNLQNGAQGAGGHMQAIQFANQFASNQSNQLLQIRAMMMAQQQAAATRAQAVADKEARQSAAAERLRTGSYQKSSGQSW